jgi:hypothetical protein
MFRYFTKTNGTRVMVRIEAVTFVEASSHSDNDGRAASYINFPNGYVQVFGSVEDVAKVLSPELKTPTVREEKARLDTFKKHASGCRCEGCTIS